jgi:tRNA(Ile)-lysidine synthase
LPGSEWQFSLSAYVGERDGAAWRTLLADPWAAPLAADNLTFPFTLRTRRPGDRFRPQGAGGWQKVGDFQTDHKIPATWRDQLPLLLAGDQIVWVCGWRVDERCVVKKKTGQVWLARFERMPG